MEIFVGPMIEKLGLKGYKVGGAMVSEKHAGFIVNVDNASGSDIVELISYLRKRVKNKYDIELRVEQTNTIISYIYKNEKSIYCYRRWLTLVVITEQPLYLHVK
jgi:hypothetical protein